MGGEETAQPQQDTNQNNQESNQNNPQKQQAIQDSDIKVDVIDINQQSEQPQNQNDNYNQQQQNQVLYQNNQQPQLYQQQQQFQSNIQYQQPQNPQQQYQQQQQQQGQYNPNMQQQQPQFQSYIQQPQQPQQNMMQPQQQQQQFMMQPQQQQQQIPMQQQQQQFQQGQVQGGQGQIVPPNMPVFQQTVQNQPGFVPQNDLMQYREDDKKQDMAQLKSPSCGNYSAMDKRDYWGGLITSCLLILGIISVISDPENYILLIIFYIIYTVEYCMCPMVKYFTNNNKTVKEMEQLIQNWRQQVPTVGLLLSSWNIVGHGKHRRREYKLQNCYKEFNYRSCQDHTGGMYPELFENTWLVRTQIETTHTMGTPQGQTAWNSFYSFWDSHANSMASNHNTEIKVNIGNIMKDCLVIGEKGTGLSNIKIIFYIVSILGFSFPYRIYFFSNISYYNLKIRKTLFL